LKNKLPKLMVLQY